MAWKSHWHKPIEKQDIAHDLETWIQEVTHEPSFTFKHPERIATEDLRAIWNALREKGLL